MNLPAAHIAEEILRQDTLIMAGYALIVFSLDEMHLTLYHAGEKLLELVRSIAFSEEMQ